MYDMDELEIQKKILLDITSRELKEEKDKWHRKYNDAEIEISHLKREVDSLTTAIHKLIEERDCVIMDIPTRNLCEVCGNKRLDCDIKCDFRWRGVKK